MRKIKVFVVDDHKLFAQGVIQLLAGSDQFEVTGWVTSGEEAINAIAKSRPDVLLMDIILKNMTGIEACRWINERYPQTKILLLSMEVNREYLSAGIQCGVNGYLHKDVEKTILFQALETVYYGGQYFADALKKLVFEDFYNRQRVQQTQPGNDLTKREHEILALVAEGKTHREISDMLFISTKTVDTHKSNILGKLGLKNNAELTRYAIMNNIITL